MKIILILLFSVSLRLITSANGTNVVYLPYERMIAFGEDAQERALEKAMEMAKNLPECRPAELDPEGNWGQIVSGFQMSIRLSTNTVAPNEPIRATVILRNTTTNSMNVIGPTATSIELVLLNEHKEQLSHSPHPITVSGPASLTLPERRQIKYQFDLDELIKQRSPGIYYVYAKRRIPDESKLQSAGARIQVVDSKRDVNQNGQTDSQLSTPMPKPESQR